MARIGDNWRLRYRGLKLHNKTPVNHLPYLPFPKTWPDYIPKDKIANWLEFYVEMHGDRLLDAHRFEGATYDEATKRWTARLDAPTARRAPCVRGTSSWRPASAARRTFPRSRRIDNFKGQVLHSSRFKAGRQWRGQAGDRVRHRHQRA